jgi:hypothetical protein
VRKATEVARDMMTMDAYAEVRSAVDMDLRCLPRLLARVAASWQLKYTRAMILEVSLSKTAIRSQSHCRLFDARELPQVHC